MKLSKRWIASLLTTTFLLGQAFASDTSVSTQDVKVKLGARFNLLPKTIDFFDAQKYQGQWYEIASTKPKFSKDCYCTKASYYPFSQDRLLVKNSCRIGSSSGETEDVIGIAKPYWFGNAIFSVSFLNTENENGLSSCLGMSVPNYWIVEADKDFKQYAVVSAPGKSPIFILSRTPQMNASLYDSVVKRLAERGFKTQKLEKTVQDFFCQYDFY